MIRQVRFDKKGRVIKRLMQRIERGQWRKGSVLPGEHRLAEEFAVSRGTLREALAELKRQNYIATQSGVGSIVTYDGQPLDHHLGWARALAASGFSVTTELLDLALVHRPDLHDDHGHTDYVRIERRRITDTGVAVSLECALVPACDGLERLPDTGLVDGSVTASLAACGFIGTHGDQWVGCRPLDAREAQTLGRAEGTVFLAPVRVTRDPKNRFVERVDSLLDPAHFRMHLTFGAPPP
ncbi:GntR family transcriptional regulator [Roseospira marina]|uniref:GntR family transcriptional regulator n=1 Tax=Roseospira marina TaxID=140057 RepID=A0A5M6IC88_9PROT|nr:GntR family transcriptional regulator [Roseospira marina]KAA5605813.1 GntR family transcriptional regulator [Roseospira marina]